MFDLQQKQGMENLENLTDDEDFLELVNIVRHPRAPRTFRERPDHFTKWNEVEFRNRFRLSKDIVKFVVNVISPSISSKTEK